MIAGMISGLGNVVLNTLFLFVFKLGILGIALATTMARGGSLAYALYRARALEAARRGSWSEETAPAPSSAFDGVLERPYWAILSLGVPSALTFVLMGTENLLVNAVLAHFKAATASLAAYAIYHRATLLSMMPIVAVGVAVLPFMARHLGEGNLAEVRRGLRQAFTLALLYVVCLAAPICLLGGGSLAAFLTKTEESRTLTAFAIRYAVPLCALASFPFLLCRPAFEGVQRGTPALIMAGIRYLLFSIPLALLGATLAGHRGLDPFYGLIAGLLTGTAIVSVVFSLWLVRMLGALEPPDLQTDKP
jgi:Na+-driven multidrug efflux pump